MILKRKYQSGGEISYIPTVDRYAADKGSAAYQSSGKSSSNKSSDIAKNVMEQVMSANGIDSDVNQFLRLVRTKLAVGSDPTGDGLTIQDVFQVQLYANKVKENAKRRDNAVQKLNAENAWGEVATTVNGQVYAIDSTGKLSIISQETFKNNRDSYRLLTNQDLLNFRESNTNAAFNQNMLNDVYNAIGTGSIVSDALKLIQAFAVNEEAGYTSKKMNTVARGLEKLIGDGPDGVYKIDVKTKFGAGGDEELTAAIKYLYDAMPNTYKNALEVKAMAEGLSEYALLGMMVQAHTNKSITPSFDSTATKAAGMDGGDGSSGSDVSMTLAESYSTGEGAGVRRMYEITPQGSNVRMFAIGKAMAPVVKADGKTPIGDATIQKLMTSDSPMIRNTTLNTVVFGDQVLTDRDKTAVMYNNSDMRRFELPAKVTPKGDIVPDWSVYEKIQKLEEYLQENEGSLTQGSINDIINERLPGAVYDAESGTIMWPQTHAFLSIGAIVSSDYVKDLNLDSKFIGKVSKLEAEEANYQNRYEETIKYGTFEHDVKAKEVVGRNTTPILHWGGARADRFYEANVWIPLNDNTIGTAVYNGQRNSKSAYHDISERSEMREERQNVRTTF